MFLTSNCFFMCLFIMGELFLWTRGMKYQECPFKKEPEVREVFAFTCDTREGWKSFLAMKVWNSTGSALRSEGLSMVNVCYG